MFFSMGDKVTKGDPKRKADFDYSMLWIIFLAFMSIWMTYVYNAIFNFTIRSLLWSFVFFGIMWFQYFNLKTIHETRKIIEEIKLKNNKISTEVESPEEMLRGFEK